MLLNESSMLKCQFFANSAWPQPSLTHTMEEINKSRLIHTFAQNETTRDVYVKNLEEAKLREFTDSEPNHHVRVQEYKMESSETPISSSTSTPMSG